MSPTKRYTLASAAASLALAALLSACSTGGGLASSEGSSTTSPESLAPMSSEHNDADTQFAQMMVLHHQGAIAMATMAEGRAQREDVQQLASAIQSAQQPEIDLMTSWLRTWGEQTPSSDDQMGGMDHSGGRTGMAGEEQMQRLESAGTAFDRMFLEMMIEHHEGAITMSREELADGLDQDALGLAEAIIDAQTEEIAAMRQTLATM